MQGGQVAAKLPCMRGVCSNSGYAKVQADAPKSRMKASSAAALRKPTCTLIGTALFKDRPKRGCPNRWPRAAAAERGRNQKPTTTHFPSDLPHLASQMLPRSSDKISASSSLSNGGFISSADCGHSHPCPADALYSGRLTSTQMMRSPLPRASMLSSGTSPGVGFMFLLLFLFLLVLLFLLLFFLCHCSCFSCSCSCSCF